MLVYKSADTETNGLEIKHGCRAFYVSIACEDGKLTTLGGPDKPWYVDVKTRRPSVPRDDALRLRDILMEPDVKWIFQNTKFDVRVFQALFEDAGIDWDAIEFISRCEDTLLQSHVIENSGSHGLKDLALMHLDISDADQVILKQMVLQCTEFAKRLGWAVAGPKTCPLYKRAPKAGWWVMDMWLPTMVAKYLEARGMDRLSSQFSVRQLLEGVNEYGGTDAVRTLCLYFPFMETLEKMNLVQMYEEQKLILPVTYKMEQRGVTIHKEMLIPEMARLDSLVKFHTKEAAKACNRDDINFDSPKQMVSIIYDHFGREITKTTGKGNPSADQDVLEDILRETAEEQPDSAFHTWAFHSTCAKKCDASLGFLEAYNRLSLRETISIFDPTSPKDIQQFIWRLYPNFNITGTDTTRFSSDNPNGQNVGKGKDPFIASIYDPLIGKLQIVEKEFGQQLTEYETYALQLYQYYLTTFQSLDLSVRKVFGPAENREWWAVDYKQLQLVIFAYVSGEKSMIEAVNRGMDFHDFMARRIFNIPDHMAVDEGQRRVAKNVNFGFIFGAGPAKIEATAGIAGLYDILQQLFPNATSFIDINMRQARREGCVYAAGYRLTVPYDKPHAATNYIIQGWEGRIVKRAMVYCDAYLTEQFGKRLDGYLSLNVHDELVFDFLKGIGGSHIGHLCNLMEVAGSELGVPCLVDAKYIEKYWNKGIEVSFSQAA